MTKRNFEEFWVTVSIPFQVFGFGSQISQPASNLKATFFYLYNVFIGIVISVIILVTFLNMPDFLHDNINSIVDYSLLYAFLLTHLIVIFESNATICNQKRIYLQLLRLTHIFQKQFYLKIELHSLQVRCMKKIWSTSLLCFSVIFIVGSTWVDFWDFFGRSVFSIIVTRMRFIQISICIDILTEYFHCLGVALQKINSNLIADDRCKMLLVVKDVYGNLIALNDLIESVFAWSITAIVAQNFLDLLNQCYWAFVNIYSMRSLSFGINIISFILGFSIPLLHLVNSCHQCKKISLKVSYLLHTLSSEQFSLQQAKLIQALSLNILQQPIQINALGVLTINYDLLAKMAGSIAAYLTIMLQFKLHEMDND